MVIKSAILGTSAVAATGILSAIGMDTVNPVEMLKSMGPWAMVVGWFIWRDYQRERQMAARIRDLEEKHRKFLEGSFTEAIVALKETTKVLKGERE